MRTLPVLVASAAATAAVLAQSNCSAGAGPATALATQTPFNGNSLYGHPNYPLPPGPTYTGFSFLWDLTLVAPIDVPQIDIDLYDSGGLVNLGNGSSTISPNQVGATTNVTLFLLPATTWLGNESNPSAWFTLGTGTLTVSTPHAHSPAVFTPPLNLPSGQWAFACKVDQTTTGPNPGPLHPMLDPNTTVPGIYTDPVLRWINVQFQRESWTPTLASAAHTQNIEIHYTPTSGYANWTSYGTGCVAPNLPALTLTSRPVIGTTVTFQTANILAGTLFDFWLFGFAADANGLSLGAFGLPGCSLYLQLGSGITINVTAVSSGIATVQLPIPNDASYSGIVLYGQSAPATSGVNAGFFASNAVCVALGLF